MSDRYVYQPESRMSDYEQAVAVLRTRYSKVKTESIDLRPHLQEICEGIQANGIPFKQLRADVFRFRDYFERAEYTTRYPEYYGNNLLEKSFEHFVALQILKPSASDVFIDVASEGSPLPEIVQRLHGSTVYAQDIMYEPGIHGNRIGGDACQMPIPNGFASCVTLTCSLEHFEGDGDTRLFRELGRVLRAGGHVVVVPLYMFKEPAIQTDPTYSAKIDIPFDRGATLYCAKGWCNRHGRFYSPETLLSRVIVSSPELRFTVYRLLDTDTVGSGIYARFVLTGEKL